MGFTPMAAVTWRVLRSQQQIARQNAAHALAIVQERRREREEVDDFFAQLPQPVIPSQRVAGEG